MAALAGPSLRDCQTAQNGHNGAQEPPYARGSTADVTPAPVTTSRAWPSSQHRARGRDRGSPGGDACPDGDHAAGVRLDGQQRFKAGVDLVQFSVVLTDKQGAPITGLKAGDFEVLEEGKPQTITYFAAGDPEDGDNLGEALPLHLGLTLDLSGSMERDIHDVRTAAIKFLNNNESAVDVTLVDFDTEIRVARYSADES